MRRRPKIRALLRPGPLSEEQRSQSYCQLELANTELEMENEALRESRLCVTDTLERYVALYDALPIASVTLDFGARILDLNLAAAQLLGVDRTGALGLPMTLFVASSGLSHFLDHLRRSRARRSQPVSFDIDLQNRHQRQYRVQIVMGSMLRERKRVLHCALVDLSGRLELERELRKGKEMVEAMLDRMRQGYLLLDHSLTVVQMNRACCALLETVLPLALGRPFDEVPRLGADGLLAREKLAAVFRCQMSFQNLSVRAEIPRLGERLFALTAELLPAQSSNQRLILLTVARAENLQSTLPPKPSGDMEAILYTIAHDLRAPLRAMEGFAQVILDDYGGQIGDLGRDCAQRIASAARREDRLIADLLEYSHLQLSSLTFASIDLTKLLNEVLLQFRDQIESQRARVRLDGPLPQVVAHRPTLERVLSHLMSNALKFVPQTAAPQVHIWAEFNGEKARLWVQDNGIGIAPDHHDRIFRAFERLHGENAYPGTGIGLAMVRRGMERIGGRVGVESELGNGARFWLEFPELMPGK